MAGQLASRKEHIRNQLQKLISDHGVTRAQLARVCGVSAPTVTNWLNGRNSIDIENLHKICARFNIPIARFIDSESVQSIPLSQDDIDFLSVYRRLSQRDKSKVKAFAKQLSHRRSTTRKIPVSVEYVDSRENVLTPIVKEIKVTDA